jgi:sarcosine oxidase subunit gamma
VTVETPARRSPLADFAAALADLPAGLRAAELPFLAQLSLRLDPAGPAAAAVAQALGCPLPSACTATSADPVQVLWLGPDEFLVLAPAGTQAELADRLRAAIGDEFGSVVDVSAQRTTLDLSGPLTREVLARGCAVDLDPRVSPPGTCVQTLLAQTGVVLLVGEHGVRLLVRSSFAPYLAAWLADACREYQEGAPQRG